MDTRFSFIVFYTSVRRHANCFLCHYAKIVYRCTPRLFNPHSLALYIDVHQVAFYSLLNTVYRCTPGLCLFITHSLALYIDVHQDCLFIPHSLTLYIDVHQVTIYLFLNTVYRCALTPLAPDNCRQIHMWQVRGFPLGSPPEGR